MIRGSDGRASMLDGGLSEFVLAKKDLLLSARITPDSW
jgi:hypothetical protein